MPGGQRSRGKGGKGAIGKAASGGVRTRGGSPGQGGRAGVTPLTPRLVPVVQRLDSRIATSLHPRIFWPSVPSTSSSPMAARSSSPMAATSLPEEASSPQTIESSAATSTTEKLTPNPSVFVKVVSQQATSKKRKAKSHRPSKKKKVKKVLNGGSEEDEPPSDDDEIGGAPLPKSALVFLQPQEDTQQEADVAGCFDNWFSEGSDDTEGPKGLFEFQWTPMPRDPISSLSGREVFTGDAGPTITDGPISTPYDIFVKIWDRAFMERIAGETNRYAQKLASALLESGEIGPCSRIRKWKDTDVDELYVYFALVIAMGIVIKSKVEDYWNRSENIFITPGFSAQMSLYRFQLITRCLHFVDNTTDCDARSPAEANIFKIKPVIDHLNVRFQQLYRLGQNIALDESLTQWKGPLYIKQYIPHKVAEQGIKTYEVCDSRSGYLWRFEVHGGSEIDSREEVVIPGRIPNIVLRLLHGLENRGHTVWMDNYYNSPALARVLKTRGFDCVGSLRTNRQFVPQEITTLNKSDMEVGTVFGVTAGDVNIIMWRDQNRVAMISTYHTLAVADGKPNVVHDYNYCMGGVDRKDQLLSAYPLERKRTLIWYRKFFRRLLNVSVLNAYIIFKTYQQINHRDFRVKLVTSILENCGGEKEVPVTTIITSKRGKFSPDVIAHLPMQLPRTASGKVRMRRRCVVCKSKRTPVICEACNVSLCYDFEEISCYVKYHS